MENENEFYWLKDYVNTNSNYYQSKSGYIYSFVFAFEKKFFNETIAAMKMKETSEYYYLGFYYALLYVALLFGSQKLMEKREKFQLRTALIAWNLVLAAFSITGSLRLWPEFIYVLQTKGLRHSYCSKDYLFGVTGGWGALFVVSKLPELLDTFFIVARKQKLIFLHWYHHFTVLIYAVFSAKDFAGSGRWFCLMNFTVHAFMYSYYAFKALRFKIPKWVNIVLTTAQIVQMVIGVLINLSAYRIKSRGEYCEISDENLQGSFVIYATYLVLFSNFFFRTYLQNKSEKKKSLQRQITQNGNGHVYH